MSAQVGNSVPSARVAALPMYDFPELREAHDRLWDALARRLRERGVGEVPQELARGLSHREVWAHPGLLFGQACEYPIAKSFQGELVVLARPGYRAPGCAGGTYRSAIVVRAGDAARGLEDLRGRRCVLNEADSNSGMNLFRAALAPISGEERFFQSVGFSGAHLRSLKWVAAGEADVTAVDCVTFALIARLRPELVATLRVVGWTPASPCLPFVVAARVEEWEIEALRAALGEVFADRALADARQVLLLQEVDLQPVATFDRVLELEGEAERLGYAMLE